MQILRLLFAVQSCKCSQQFGAAGVFTYLQKLVGCKHSNSDGVERHQREHVALVAVGFVLVTLQLLLHQLLHLLHVLRGLRRTGGVHVDGLTSHCAWALTCCYKYNSMRRNRGDSEVKAQ